MDVRVYDFDFKLLCIMSDIISSSWTVRHNDIGTYEGHFSLNDKVAQIILSEPYLIITEGEQQAVCTGKIVDTELLVCGRTLNWLLSKRVIPPFKTREIFGDEFCGIKEICKYILQRAFTEPPQIGEEGLYLENTVDLSKRVENFTLPSVENDFLLNRYFWRNSANTAEEVIKDLCDSGNIGHRLYFNTSKKSWDFEFVEGREKTIILSEQNGNLYDSQYTEDIEDAANGAWYEVYASDGEEKEWKYLKTDTELCGMKFWERKLTISGLSEAESIIEKCRPEYTFQGTVLGLKYLKDYNLGDTISAYMRYGDFEKRVKYKIIGVNLWHTGNESGEEPILKQEN